MLGSHEEHIPFSPLSFQAQIYSFQQQLPEKPLNKNRELNGITLNVRNSTVLDLRIQELPSPVKTNTQYRRTIDKDNISLIFPVTL